MWYVAEGKCNSKKNNSRKLRFEGTGSEATEEKETSKMEHRKTKVCVNPEFDKIVKELVLDSFVVVLKALQYCLHIIVSLYV